MNRKTRIYICAYVLTSALCWVACAAPEKRETPRSLDLEMKENVHRRLYIQRKCAYECNQKKFLPLLLLLSSPSHTPNDVPPHPLRQYRAWLKETREREGNTQPSEELQNRVSSVTFDSLHI